MRKSYQRSVFKLVNTNIRCIFTSVKQLKLKAMNFTSIMNQPRVKVTELTIGHNYADVFGLDRDKQAMIYNGGISWTAKDAGREMTIDCQKTTEKVLEYLNRL